MRVRTRLHMPVMVTIILIWVVIAVAGVVAMVIGA